MFHDLWNRNSSWTCVWGYANPESCNAMCQLLAQTYFETVPHTHCTNMNSKIAMKAIVLAGLSLPVIVAILLVQSGILYRQTHSISLSTHTLVCNQEFLEVWFVCKI